MTYEGTLAASTRVLPAHEDHVDALLDHALEATFPASDPVALTVGGALPIPAMARPAARPGRRHPRPAEGGS